MREPVGACHPLAMTACSRKRPTWHIREEAGEIECTTSFFAKGTNKLMTNQIQTLRQVVVNQVI